MGKRSNFPRVSRDFYPTPFKAVPPLVPHLRGVRRFAELCCGDGALVRHLESFGLRCVYAGDISSGQDALARDHYGAADAIITNPPWSRDVLHGLITHFQNIAPTWLLLDADWKETRQAAPFLPHCSDIVAIGRVKWIEGSKHTGKDNTCWHLFDSKHTSGPVFHWRDQGEAIPSRRTRLCEQCGKRYERWQRSSSRFCTPACRQRAHHKRLSVTLSVTPAPAPNTPTKPSESVEVFRYVRHSDVPRFAAEGWELLPEIERHGFGPGSKSLWSLPREHTDDAHPISSEEDHRPKTIDGHEVIGLEPDDPCTYCGERDGTVYLIRNTYKGLSEPMHESCAVAWFGWLRERGRHGQV